MILSKLTRGMLWRKLEYRRQFVALCNAKKIGEKIGYEYGSTDGYARAEAEYTKILTVPNDKKYITVFDPPDRPRWVVAVPPVERLHTFRADHPDVVPTRTVHTVDFEAVQMGFETHGRILTWWQWQPVAWSREPDR